MTTTITLAGRVLRRDQIALVEVFDPVASKLENAAGSQARVILSNGRNFLIPNAFGICGRERLPAFATG
jgi:hypothetical protein